MGLIGLVDVRPKDIPAPIDIVDPCADRVGEINRCEYSLTQKKSVHAGSIAKKAHDIAGGIYSECGRHDGSWNIDVVEIASTIKKASSHAGAGIIESNDIPLRIDPKDTRQ